jgi:hypothetical protein
MAAKHIEEGYEERGLPKDEAERQATATVNKATQGGKKQGQDVARGDVVPGSEWLAEVCSQRGRPFTAIVLDSVSQVILQPCCVA